METSVPAWHVDALKSMQSLKTGTANGGLMELRPPGGSSIEGREAEA
ncbi:MAG: hypothetical protein KY476_09650 [Planctomycetes bacterium]|nr:hypothetical protein [Planctomycetota bacterium]